MPSHDFTNEDLFSSPMMSMQSSTHSSQINTVGPAMSFRTSCWLLPKKEQYSVFFESPPLDLVIAAPSLHLRGQGGQGRRTGAGTGRPKTPYPSRISISAPDRSTMG